MNILLIIFLGGGTGATFRYLISELVNKLIPTSIGYGTISVNLIGAFLMGALFYFISSKLLISNRLNNFIFCWVEFSKIFILIFFTFFYHVIRQTLVTFLNHHSYRCRIHIII